MNDSAPIIQNRLHEITVNLERAHLLQCDGNWMSDGSVPPYSSIGLILEGEGTMRINGTEIHPSKGQLYLLPSKTTQVFFTNPDRPYRKYYCHFELNCQNQDLFEFIRLPFCVDTKDFDQASMLFQKMICACNSNDITASIMAKQAVFNLLVYYMECCPEGSISQIENKEDTPLNNAITFATQHLDQPITVQQMAEISGYHPSHFAKLFQKRLGVTPLQFILRQKTKRATELLTSTDLPVSSIAESLGFANQFYFSSFFKKQTGMTPSQYRNVYLRSYL